ncbi:MAG: hypothetical protein AAGA01_01515 [Cyanobacteria bacterium P01_E01_bin.43]
MLTTLIRQLEAQIVQIAASGPVASTNARLDISTHSKSGYEYARLRDGDVLTSCGRVGSEKYLEVLPTLQRRDKIEHLRHAIASLKQADKIPPKISALAQSLTPIQPPTAQPKSKPPTPRKKKGRKQLYTHVKTRQGTVVHAVPGKDKSGAWHTPALCGATPPKRDRMGWEFPEHDDGITCPKCRRKLTENSERYIPSF